MAGAINFANEKQSIQIYNYLKQNENDIFYEGQVREIPFPTQWTDKSIGKSIDPMSTIRIYQNGGYWATPHHHVLLKMCDALYIIHVHTYNISINDDISEIATNNNFRLVKIINITLKHYNNEYIYIFKK